MQLLLYQMTILVYNVKQLTRFPQVFACHVSGYVQHVSYNHILVRIEDKLICTLYLCFIA